jgi:ubiquinone/menaquinone biosynthesis C-methylase UbiE
MSYLDRDAYRKLYARYVAGIAGRPVSGLLEMAGDLRDMNVLDLCGGAGELSVEAKRRGASKVAMVDECAEMFDRDELVEAGVDIHVSDVETWLFIPKPGRCLFDFVFCRQAVNYWLSDEAAALVALNLHSGGHLIFNTFNRKPAAEPVVKRYSMMTGACLVGGESTSSEYVEVSWLVGDMVHHIQIREGLEPHHTKFKWIPPEEFRRMLGPYFDVEETRDGASSIYNCVKC